DDGSDVVVMVHPSSTRLQLLEPFTASPEAELDALPVLLKAKGKTTTDHISAAGPWLQYRGHLENISSNLFLSATNGFTGQSGIGRCPVHHQPEPFPDC